MKEGLLSQLISKGNLNMNEEQKTKVLNDLKNGPVTVTFTKVNGDKRVMTCTLKEGVIPKAKKEDPLTQKKVRAINPEVCSVWDVNAEGWRSFRWANVVEVNNAI